MSEAIAASDAAPIYYTTKEAAGFLRLAPATLERWRLTGWVGAPRYFKVGPGRRSRVLYLKSDLVDWLARRSFASTSEYPH